MNTPAPRDDLATSQSHSPEEAARARLRGLGSRVTEPRVRVLAVLMQGADPLSHQAVCDALPDDSGIDRVTVYRVLDWLVAGGIVHKTAGADRVFRFSLPSTTPRAKRRTARTAISTARNVGATSAWRAPSRRPCRRPACPPASRPTMLNSPSRALARIARIWRPITRQETHHVQNDPGHHPDGLSRQR